MLHAITPLAAPPSGAVCGHAAAGVGATAANAGAAVHAGAFAPSALAASAPAANDSIAVRIGRELESARTLEREARDAVNALQRGDRADVEGVLLATRKADAAFQMLQAVRNAMMQAYAEIRDMHV